MGKIAHAMDDAEEQELKDALAQTSTTIHQLTFALLIYAGFVLLVAWQTNDEWSFAGPQEQVAVRLPGFGDVPLNIAVFVGPAILISIWVGIIRYVWHWRYLNANLLRKGWTRSLSITPMRDDILHWGAWAVRWFVVPLAMIAISYKALAAPIGGYFVIVTIVLILAHMIQFFPAGIFGLAFISLLILLIGLTLIATIRSPELSDLSDPTTSFSIDRPLNLREADLSNRILDQRDFGYADLRNSNLRNSSFVAANFSSADISGADLSRANFVNADLSSAYLQGANLTEANLSFANLTNAILVNAQLEGALLEGAVLNGAVLSGADLSGVQGLSCDQFVEANGWTSARGSKVTSCGEISPETQSKKDLID